MSEQLCFIFFFFNDTATTEIYTLSLHDALPISFTSFASFTPLLPSRPAGPNATPFQAKSSAAMFRTASSYPLRLTLIGQTFPDSLRAARARGQRTVSCAFGFVESRRRFMGGRQAERD